MNYLAYSHKYYPLYPTKNTHHVTTKIGLENYIISIKSPSSFTLWTKLKSLTKPLQSPFLHRTSKVPYDSAPLKPVATRHL